MMEKIEILEVSKRKLLGDGLGSCSVEELKQIERQLERSVTKIRSRKAQVYQEQIQKLKETVNSHHEEMALVAENEELREKCGNIALQACNKQKENLQERESSPSSEVETELVIGLPETRVKRFITQG
uniref:MADS2 n=1 Tax=Hippophae rhamnoides TaxID=193516 RepID=A0AAU7LJ91_9ROSA